MNAAVNNLTKQNPLVLAVAGVAILAGLYYIGREATKDAYSGAKTVAGDVGETVGGVFTGNNAITRDTPYQGGGVLGTLGAATNGILGGVPQKVGEKIGGWAFDIFGPSSSKSTEGGDVDHYQDNTPIM